MKERTVYRVEIRDEEFEGQTASVLGVASDAGDAEKKALAAVRKKDGKDAWPKAYAAGVAVIGTLRF